MKSTHSSPDVICFYSLQLYVVTIILKLDSLSRSVVHSITIISMARESAKPIIQNSNVWLDGTSRLPSSPEYPVLFTTN